MNVNYIALAVPFFLGLIALEYIVCLKKNKKYYRFEDSIANLANGIGQQALGLIFKVVALGGYAYVYENFSITTLSMKNPLHWIYALVIGDICYYWFHRASHRSNLLVGTHTVHHQTEEFNLTVALRQSWVNRLFNWVFYLPMAILGAPPLMYIGVGSIVLVYQFWIHTRLIGTLGPLEYILVTPSHHRVHHGKNGRYLDSNYGAIFIWWDMLFGSFQKEDEPVEYGVVNSIGSWNSFWGNLIYYSRLIKRTKLMRSTKETLKLWLGVPEWKSENEIKIGKTTESLQLNNMTSKQKPIAFISLIAILGLLSVLYVFEGKMSFGLKVISALSVASALGLLGLYMDGKLSKQSENVLKEI